MRNLKSRREHDLSRLLSKIRSQAPELVEKLTTLKIDWFQIKNVAEEDEAVLYIYDEIMPAYMAEWFGGVSAEGLIAQLNEVTAKTISVRINSPGGAVFEAIAIYNALMSHSATVNVYIDSLAASAASVIAMAGDKITMMVGSQMMIHDAIGVEYGNAAELRDFADFLDRQSQNIATIYAEKTGGDPDELRQLMLAETWMFADEAVELGLADEVYKRPEAAEEEEEEEPEEGEESEPEEETPEEKDPEEESEEEGDTPPDEEELENLMHRRHAVAAKGFKYAGRNRAPAPTNESVDAMVDVFAKFFGGK
jgi:ATP-dependent protease ClpP protease subunit